MNRFTALLGSSLVTVALLGACGELPDAPEIEATAQAARCEDCQGGGEGSGDPRGGSGGTASGGTGGTGVAGTGDAGRTGAAGEHGGSGSLQQALNGPVAVGDAERDYGSGKHASCHASLDSRGVLTLDTRTWTNSEFQGFTGGVLAFVVDANGTVLATSEMVKYGVDGRWIPFGSASDRRDIERQELDPAIVPHAHHIEILLFHAPTNRLIPIILKIGEIGKGVGQAACTAARAICSVVPGGCGDLSKLCPAE